MSMADIHSTEKSCKTVTFSLIKLGTFRKHLREEHFKKNSEGAVENCDQNNRRKNRPASTFRYDGKF